MRFGNRYRIPSARLRGWDYASADWYFVTVCTRDRGRWIGEVIAETVRLSQAGEIAAEELRNTEKVRESAGLGCWVVMPDHLHAIIVIENDAPRAGCGVIVPGRLGSGSLGSVVGQFKSVCTKRTRGIGVRGFAWQSRFHEHIIRNQTALTNTRQYIEQNQSNWATDNDDNPSLP